ncbi:hypothetical protein Cantr_07870 [Candida viswanathii]|uniref:Uncharacterized protein n=1 Tax=Candida viswanathii TaxID=5486 RepID=A0A367XZA7_9ASCO|nr:hypothetical protein Cantr_07870 [Candida viswanathii]
MFRLTRPIKRIPSSKIVSFNSRRLLTMGTKGQPTWPLPSYLVKNYAHSTWNLLGWAVALLVLLVDWPAGIVGGFDVAHNVPSDHGSQVHLKRVGWGGFDATVDIPHAYVGLNKDEATGEDDE